MTDNKSRSGKALNPSKASKQARRARAEENLLFKNTLLKAQSEASIDGILIVDDAGKTSVFNNRFREIWGIPDDILETNDDNLMIMYVLNKLKYPNEFIDRVKRLYEHTDEKSRDEIELKDGKVLDRYSAPLLDAEGKYHGRVWYFRDITESKLADKALRESEVQYRRLFEAAKDGILILDAETGMVNDVNPFLTQLLGYSHENFIGKEIWELGFFKDIVTNKEHFEQLKCNEYIRYEDMPLEASDGRRIQVEFISNTYLVNDHKVIQCNIRDISERKRAEKELRESKALIEAVVENVPLMIFLKEATDLRFVIFNRAGEELLGYDRKDLLGKNNLDLFPSEQAAHFMAKDREVLDGETGILDIPEEPIMTAKKGQRLLHTTKVCIKGADGNTKYLLGISEDITERKRSEEKLREAHDTLEDRVKERTTDLAIAREEANRANKAKSTFLANMSHELRTPLNSINGFSELLLGEKFGNLNEMQETYLKNILTSGEHLLSLINDILDLSKVEAEKIVLEPEEIDLRQTLEASLNIVRQKAMEQNISLELETSSGPKTVVADQRCFKQIMYNLLSNAVKFTPDNGKVGIIADSENGSAVITVWDTGIGISKKGIKNIFQPFVQLDSSKSKKYEGTGLGLALVRRLVELHGGRVWVDSVEGTGSRFHISIPLSSKAV